MQKINKANLLEIKYELGMVICLHWGVDSLMRASKLLGAVETAGAHTLWCEIQRQLKCPLGSTRWGPLVLDTETSHPDPVTVVFRALSSAMSGFLIHVSQKSTRPLIASQRNRQCIPIWMVYIKA
jgi:hypothetical protein